MKKKIFSFLLAFVLLIPCVLSLTACKDEPQDLTNSEKATIYKDVAKSTWSEIGVSDPTMVPNTFKSAVATIPDKKVETTLASDVLQVKINANNMAGTLYLIGSLYENSNFNLTNGVAKFSATAFMGGANRTYDFVLKPSLDVKNNKVYLEAYITVDGTMPQYICVDANYNFETKTLVSFRLYTITAGTYLDIEMTEDNKNKIYFTTDSEDSFAVAVEAKKDAFVSETAEVENLTISFSAEVQVYMTLLNAVISQLM